MTKLHGKQFIQVISSLFFFFTFYFHIYFLPPIKIEGKQKQAHQNKVATEQEMKRLELPASQNIF